ncbi:hypothetical protein DFAR_1540063 [Desulfarculales bacterium]
MTAERAGRWAASSTGWLKTAPMSGRPEVLPKVRCCWATGTGPYPNRWAWRAVCSPTATLLGAGDAEPAGAQGQQQKPQQADAPRAVAIRDPAGLGRDQPMLTGTIISNNPAYRV